MMRFFLLMFAFTVFNGFSQKSLKDSTTNTFLIGLNYKANLSGADMADRWGFTNHIGIDVDNKFKNNLTVGLSGGFLFGNSLKDTTIFTNLINEYGKITSWAGDPADVLFLMRGFTGHATIGYVFNKFGNNPNSGIWLKGGLGYMGHKIRIESLYHDVPQLEGEYRLGYDKLTLGFSATQFIGYLYQADYRLIKAYAGFEFVQGLTQNVRTYNFDTGGPETDLRFDMTYGFKVGLVMPISQRTRGQLYY